MTKANVPTQFDDSSSPLREGVELAQETEIPLAEKNPLYYNFSDDLPSSFIFYKFDTLSIRPFTIKEVMKINRGKKLNDLRPIVDAISACIDEDKSARHLTMPDLWALLTWERINSYKKKVFEFQHFCVDDDHLEKVKSKKLDRNTLVTTSQITAFNQIEVVYADVEKLTDLVNKTFEEHGVYLFPATVADFIEEQEMEHDIRDNPNLPQEEKSARLTDLEFITKYASHLSKHHGETLLQRIEFIENNLDNPDVLAAIDEFIDACDYGLKETVKATCKECGASQDIPMSFDVLTFFP